jgi:hypothetical protein
MNDLPHNGPSCPCSCCSASRVPVTADGFTRREFIAGAAAVAAGGLVLSQLRAIAAEPRAAGHRAPERKPLRMQPVLTYETPARRNATSWRNWGAIQKEADAEAERNRIEKELKQLTADADFALELRPVELVKNASDAARVAEKDHDGVIMYAAGGWLDALEKLADPKKFNLMFLRHQSGPVYLWYEIAHNRFLRKTVDDFGQPGMEVDDVVVDDPGELLWRLRALYGLRNTLGKRIVAIGGAAGWGEGGKNAPRRAQELWKLDLVDVPYDDLGRRIKAARANTARVRDCEKAAEAYLSARGVSLQTERGFVERAFVLNEVFQDLLDEAGTDALTINHCMGTVMPMSETTACLPLSLLNDEGYLAFCESDFVVIPSGILLHYIAGKPVFLNDPTYPYKNTVTIAHCTAPRKMDGRQAEPTKILTHFESDYGAAPKVDMKVGQIVTNLIPDFASRKWSGFAGTIVSNPFLDICRSQVDVKIHGSTQRLLEEMKGFHWMTCYGDYLRETGYALRKVGVDFVNLSAAASV